MAIADGLNKDSIPKVISAQTPRGLRLLMWRTNNKHGVTFRYFDIQFAQNKWWAWYHFDIKSEIEEQIRESE